MLMAHRITQKNSLLFKQGQEHQASIFFYPIKALFLIVRLCFRDCRKNILNLICLTQWNHSNISALIKITDEKLWIKCRTLTISHPLFKSDTTQKRQILS